MVWQNLLKFGCEGSPPWGSLYCKISFCLGLHRCIKYFLFFCKSHIYLSHVLPGASNTLPCVLEHVRTWIHHFPPMSSIYWQWKALLCKMVHGFTINYHFSVVTSTDILIISTNAHNGLNPKCAHWWNYSLIKATDMYTDEWVIHIYQKLGRFQRHLQCWVHLQCWAMDYINWEWSGMKFTFHGVITLDTSYLILNIFG